MTSMTFLPYRPNVCIIIRNRQGLLLLGERFGEPGIWQFPQGGIDPGDSEESTVFREAEEELGIKSEFLKVVAKLSATHRYDFDRPPSYAINKWRGQEQSFWLLDFVGDSQDIILDKHQQEFSAVRWCTIDEVRKIAEPKRLPGYEPALKEIEEIIRNTSH